LFLNFGRRHACGPEFYHDFWCSDETQVGTHYHRVSLLIQSVEKTVLSPLKPRLILRILTHACTSRLSMAKGEHGGF